MPQSAHRRIDAPRVPPRLEVLSASLEHSGQTHFSDQDRETALSLMHRDSFYSQTVNTLTTGLFLTGYALQFKAPNFIIGLLVAIPFLAQLLQLPTIELLKRYPSRQKICAWATLLSRLFLIPAMLVPLIPSSRMALLVLIVSYIGHNGIGAVSLCAWNAMIKDVVPTGQLGLFTSRKLALNAMVAIVISLLGGYFIDSWSHGHPYATAWGYGLIFMTAILAGIVGARPLFRIPEPQTPSRDERENGTPQEAAQKPSIFSLLKQPLKDVNFRRMLYFMGSWNFAINLAVPFFAVYMLTMLKYPMALVTGLTIAGQVANLIFVRLWGRLADQFSNKSVLSVAAPVFITCMLIWTCIPYTQNIQLTFPLAILTQLLLGIAAAGVNVASGNIALKLAPAKESEAFLAVNGMVASVAAGIAPIFGGLFADFFSRQELSLVLQWHSAKGHLALKTLDFQYWDFFFALAFVLGLISLSLLGRVREHGDVRKTIIVNQLITETVRPLTSISRFMGL